MTSLIEKLIISPGDETTKLLYEDGKEIFWVDWREDDSCIAEYCEYIINSGKLSSYWEEDRLFVKYGDNLNEVQLTHTESDRHITLLAINRILEPEFEIRLVWDADGGDTGAFAILHSTKWQEYEQKHGLDTVSKAFLKLTSDLNTFTDPLHKHRPGQKSDKAWWQFWR